MAKTYLSLGSNLGDRMAYLKLCADALPGRKRCSQVYETEPVDAPEGSRSFLNAVIELELEPDSAKLLSLVSLLEGMAGRERNEINGPRTLDVDVVYVEGYSSSDPLMMVPHPRASDRAFVVAPINDLNPALASALNVGIALSVSEANRKGIPEVFPGVLLVHGPLC